MKKLKKRLLVFLLSMAMICPMLLEPLTVRAEGETFTADPKQSSFTVNGGEQVTLEVVTSAPAGTVLTYEWSKEYQGDDGWYGQVLEGETGSSYQTEPITAYSRYSCKVSNQDASHVQYVFFYITRQNHLQVQFPSRRVTLERGQSVTLTATAYADDPEGITYKWDHGPTTSSCVVSEPGEYVCSVTDKYGNTAGRVIEVAYENHFVATAQQEKFSVSYGGNATLKVNVSGDDLTGITYSWSKIVRVPGSTDTYGEQVDGQTTDTLSLTNITEAQSYGCDVCDAYGNTAYVSFNIEIDNHLTVTADSPVYNVAPGEQVTLQVYVTADDTSGVTYQWYQNGDNYTTIIDGATGSSYKTGSITGASYYYCRVEDRFGNSKRFDFSVRIQNDFSARAENDTVIVAKGAKATLKLIPTGNDLTGLKYEWYEIVESQSTNGTIITNDVRIQGASGDSYVTPAINEPKMYRGKVTDRYGTYSTVIFHVAFENHFSAQTASSSVNVAPGEKATLSVSVSADDMSKVTYTWYKYVSTVSPTGTTYSVRTLINGASQNTYVTDAISGSETFDCVVEDGYGSSTTIYFNVRPDNHFEASAVEDTIRVAYGTSAELQVIVSADDMTGVTYQWSDGNWNALQGETSSKLTIRSVTQAAEYWCQAKDQYGNSNYIFFSVGPQNHLKVQAEAYAVTIDSGKSATLRVIVSADDVTGVTYQWNEMIPVIDSEAGYVYSTPRAIEGATGSSYQTPAITEATEYSCVVTDKYGNSETQHYKVSISNHLQVRSITGTKEYQVGEKATLKVEVSANDMTGITYAWRRYRYVLAANGTEQYEDEVVEANGSDTCVTQAITESWFYQCTVTDKLGNTAFASIPVLVANNFRVTKRLDYEVPLTGGKARLEVKVRANNTNGIKYSWIKRGEDYSAQVLSYGTTPYVDVTECGSYECKIMDAYGTLLDEYYEVIPDSDFLAWAAEPEVVIPSGGSATLKVETNAASTAGITYEWYYYQKTYNEFGMENGASYVPMSSKTATLVLRSDAQAGEYICYATDSVGAKRRVSIQVYQGKKQEITFTSNLGDPDEDGTFSVAEGKTIKITATASGFGSGLTYHWSSFLYENGSSRTWYYDDQTTKTLTFTPSGYLPYSITCCVVDSQGNCLTKYCFVLVKNECTLTFQANGGSGSMDKDLAQKYYEYELPECEFTAPEGKVFAGWDVNGELYEEGETIIPGGNVTVKATWKKPDTDESLVITGVNLTLQDNLSFNLFSSKSLYDKEGYGEPYVVFNVNGTEKTVHPNPKKSTDTDYAFTCNNIAPHMIGDEIGFTIYVMKGDQRITGMSSTYSVTTYCGKILDAYKTKSKLTTMIVDLLNYGAAAQNYMDYKTDSLVNAGLTSTQQSWATGDRAFVDVTEKLNESEADLSDAAFVGAALNLGETVAIRYVFTAESLSGLTLKVTDEKGSSWTFTESDFVPATEDGLTANSYSLYCRKLHAGRMSDKVYATLYRDGEKSMTVAYSIESYASKAGTGTSKLQLLLKAMMKYGDAAKACAEQ